MSLKRYVPALPELNFAAVLREFLAIGEMANKPEPYVYLQVLHAEPERVFEGMEVLADGTDWDPGSGPGRYYYFSGAWRFLG